MAKVLQSGLRVTFLAAVSLVVFACAQFNPISQAETVEQKALAAYGSLTIMVETVASMVEPGTLPRNVQSSLISAGERGGAVAKAGLEAYNRAQEAKAAYQAGAANGESNLSIAVTNLNTWLDGAQKTIEELNTAIKGAQ